MKPLNPIFKTLNFNPQTRSHDVVASESWTPVEKVIMGRASLLITVGFDIRSIVGDRLGSPEGEDGRSVQAVAGEWPRGPARNAIHLYSPLVHVYDGVQVCIPQIDRPYECHLAHVSPADHKPLHRLRAQQIPFVSSLIRQRSCLLAVRLDPSCVATQHAHCLPAVSLCMHGGGVLGQHSTR